MAVANLVEVVILVDGSHCQEKLYIKKNEAAQSSLRLNEGSGTQGDLMSGCGCTATSTVER